MTIVAALSSSVFAAVFVLAMSAAIIGFGFWVARRDRDHQDHR